jgi:uncharacterized membrane protein YsdA (DUF1294 family)
MSVFLTYLLIVNIVGGVIFALDKQAAIKNRWRVPEKTLHLLELAGAVFSIGLLMYLLHHKNRKLGYFLITYWVMAVWIALLLYIELKK